MTLSRLESHQPVIKWFNCLLDHKGFDWLCSVRSVWQIHNNYIFLSRFTKQRRKWQTLTSSWPSKSYSILKLIQNSFKLICLTVEWFSFLFQANVSNKFSFTLVSSSSSCLRKQIGRSVCYVHFLTVARNLQWPWGTLRNLNEPWGTLRNPEKPSGTFRDLYKPSGTSRNLQRPLGMCSLETCSLEMCSLETCSLETCSRLCAKVLK